MEIMAVGAAAAAIPQPTAEMVDLAAAVGVVQRHNQTYLDSVRTAGMVDLAAAVERAGVGFLEINAGPGAGGDWGG